MKSNIARLAVAFLMSGVIASACFAQSYPSKPIRLIVPAAPGSPPDIRARWIAEKLRPALGQALIVDNKSGAAGIIGTQAAARSAADGYTLVMVHQGTLALNPHLYSDLPYDPIKDLAPVSRLVVSPLMLTVHPESPARSVADLVRLGREKPGQLNFGFPGVGTPPHMAGELFTRLAQVDVMRIPYNSAPAAQIDLIGGRLTYTFDGVATALPQVRAGKLRGLAVTSGKRLAALPDIPTVAESGLPGYEYWSWMGISAPAGTPKEIISRLNAEITRILKTREARDWFAEQGGEPIIETPEEFAAYIKSEYSHWGKVIREAGIRAE
jgi:tripartite-type tricarboxylate transporter receptor subunit TctC